MRKIISALLMVIFLIGCATTPSLETAGIPRRVLMEVRNDSNRPVVVYVLRGSTKYRVGHFEAVSKERIYINRDMGDADFFTIEIDEFPNVSSVILQPVQIVPEREYFELEINYPLSISFLTPWQRK